MYKHLFRYLLNYRVFNPVYRLILECIRTPDILSPLNRQIPIIVSLSSEEENFNNLPITLYSIFNQAILPDKVILWLSDEYELSELPYSITKFIKNGLEIRFVREKNEYTKITNVLKEFESSITVVADDDIYYPKNWLKSLYHSYIANPDDIQVHTAIRVPFVKDNILSVRLWNKVSNKERALYEYFPVSSGGILFPPNCFSREIYRADIYNKKVGLVSWSVWCWFMALISDRKVRIVKNHIKNFACTGNIKRLKKRYTFYKNYVQFDEKILRLMEYYGQNIRQKLSKR